MGSIFPIDTLRIENFRGIRSATLALHPKVTVFFGANAAGKTTILDALAIALGALVARIPTATGRDFAKSGSDIRIPWKDRPAVGEKRGVVCPYARVEVSAANGLRWDVTRLRSAQDRRTAPPGIGTKALHGALDGIVSPPGEAPAALRIDESLLGSPNPGRDAHSCSRSGLVSMCSAFARTAPASAEVRPTASGPPLRGVRGPPSGRS